MEPEGSPDEDGPLFAYLPPDDRLWRHPSEMPTVPPGLARATTTVERPVAVRVWTVAVLAGMVGALVASGVSVAVGGFDARRTTVVAPVTRMITPNTLASASLAPATSWPSVVDAISPSVASVAATSATGEHNGSGVVYAVTMDQRRTYLLTDAGLVAQSGAITVTFNGGNPVRAYLVHIDAKTGLALLWVAGSAGTAPLLGSISYLHEADQVMAVGARPTGVSPPVAASVSSLDRTVVDTMTSTALSGLLAIGATAPSGDAGGAVIDERGNLVGITTSVSSSASDDAGTSFAVPIEVAMHVASQMIVYRPVTHPWLGVVDSTDLDSTTAARMGLEGGAQLIGVADGSPLAQAGVRPLDVIVGLDGHPVTSSGELTALLDAQAPGDVAPGAVATVSYLHLGRAHSASLRVVEQPTEIDP